MYADEEEEAAAIRIQSTYRGYQTRKHMQHVRSSTKDTTITNTTNNSNNNDMTSQLNDANANQNNAQQQDDEEEEDEDEFVDVLVSSDDENENENKNEIENEAAQDACNYERGEMDQAAIRIQATYRGFRTRKELVTKKRL